MCLLAAYQLQCRSSLCLHPGSGHIFSCFYIASLWLRRFLWVGRRRLVFVPSSLCVWNQTPRRSRQIILLPLGFCTDTFKNSTDSQNLWCHGSISPKAIYAGHYWRSRDELISDILLWVPSHGRAKIGRPARTYIRQLCADTGCSLEDLPGAMNDQDGRGSGRSVLAVRHHEYDEVFLYWKWLWT